MADLLDEAMGSVEARLGRPASSPSDAAAAASTPAPAAAAPPVDVLDQAMANLEQRAGQDAALDRQFAAWQATNTKLAPDRAAEVLRYSAASGLEPTWVADNLDTVKKQVDATKLERVLADHPTLARYMGDPTKAALVQDDAASLHGLEWALLGRGDPATEGEVPALERGYFAPKNYVSAAPVAALRDSILRTVASSRQALESIGLGSEDNRARIEELKRLAPEKDYGARGWWQKAFLAPFNMAPQIGGDVGARSGGAGVGAFIGSAIAPGIGTAVGVVVGQWLGSFSFNTAQTVGAMQEQLREIRDENGEPIDPEAARSYAWAGAATSGALMATSFGKVGGALAPKIYARLGAMTAAKALAEPTLATAAKRFALQYGEHVAAGAAIMAAQSGVSALTFEGAKKDYLGTDINWDAVTAAGAHGLVQGLQDMTLLAAWGPGRDFLENVGRIHVAAENAGRFEAIATNAAGSKLLERAPAEFRELIRSMKGREGAVDAFYSPVKAWDTFWQGKKVDPAEVAATVLQDGGKAYAEAKQTGGDLRLPSEDLLTRLAKSPHAGELALDMKLSQDGITLREARLFQEEFATRVKDRAAVPPEQMETGQRAVYEDYRAKVVATKKVSEAEADGNAKIVAATFQGWAEQLRTTADELYRRMADVGISVAGEQLEPGMARAAQLGQPSRLVPMGRATLDLDREIPAARVAPGEFDAIAPKPGEAPAAEDVRRFALEHVKGEHVNEETGWSIDVTSNSVAKALNYPTAENRFALLKLPELLRNATRAETADHRHADANVLAVHTLYSPLAIGDALHRVKLTVREVQHGGGAKLKQYALESVEIETSPAAARTAGARSAHADAPVSARPGPSTIVRDLLRGAKWDDGTPVIPENTLSQSGVANGPNGGRVSVHLDQRDTERGWVTFSAVDGDKPQRFQITLGAGADRSTLAHETFHMLAEVMGRLATQEGAPIALRRDFETLSSWMGYASPEERLALAKERSALSRQAASAGEGKGEALSAEEKGRLRELTAKEERASHGWEQFLAEGKAPSPAMAGVFARFANWMKKIYRSVEGVNAQFRAKYGEEIGLNDQVRDVFRRLVAADEAVDQVLRGAEPIPEVLAAMTPEERSRWEAAKAEERAHATADVIRRIADAQNAEREGFIGEEHARLRAEAEAELDNDPTYRALWFFAKGEARGVRPDAAAELIDADKKPLKVDRKSLLARYGKWFVDTLPRGVASAPKTEGVDADFIAERLGFQTGDEMLMALRAAEPRARKLESRVAERMAELYGPTLLADPQKVADIALAAAENESAARAILTEIAAMRRELAATIAKGGFASAEFGLRARAVVDVETVKDTARRLLAAKTYSELSPKHFRAAEVASLKRAAELYRKGKVAEAIDEQEARLLDHYLASFSAESREEFDRRLANLRRHSTPEGRAELGKATSEDVGPDGTKVVTRPYLEKVDALLDDFELRASASLRDVRSRTEKRAELEQWVAARAAEGEDVVIPPSVLANLERTKHWKDLTLAEVRDLDDAVESIAHQATLKTTLLTSKGRRDRAEAKGRLISALFDNMPRIGVFLNPDAAPLGDRAGAVARGIKSVVIRPEELIREMDGGRGDGPWHELYWNVLSDADYAFRDLRAEVTKPILEALDKLPRDVRKALKTERFTEAGQPMTMEQALAVALNWGNDSNRNKLLKGYADVQQFGPQNWTPETAERILSRLRREHWELVQRIWDQLESMWPKMAALEKRLTGIEPPKVERRAFTRTLADGTTIDLAGGYYPVVYDPQFPGAGQRQAENAATPLARLFDPGYYRATTPQGHLQARSENYARPILLTLDALPRHIDQAAKDVTMREAFISAHDIITDQDVQAAMLQTIGKEGIKVLQGSLRDTANDLVMPDGGEGWLLDKANKARGGLTGAVFAFNIGQWLQNLTGFVNARDQVPGAFLREGIWKFRHGRGDTIAEIQAKSGEMRSRSDHVDRDVGDELRKLLGQSGPLARAKEAGLWMFQTTDKVVAYAAWWGSYQHALAPAEKGGLALGEEAAVQHADKVVRTALASARTLDLPAVMRSKNLKLITMFQGWGNMQLNQIMAAGHDARLLAGDGQYYAAARRFTKTWMLLALAGVLSKMATGGGPSDDDGEGVGAGDVAKFVAAEGVGAPRTWIPIFGPIAKSVGSGRGVDLTPWTRPLESAAKTSAGAWKLAADYADTGELDPEKLSRQAALTLEAAGYYYGLPVAQVAQTGRYVADWSNTDFESRPVGEHALGVAFGKQRKGKLSQLIYGEEL